MSRPREDEDHEWEHDRVKEIIKKIQERPLHYLEFLRRISAALEALREVPMTWNQHKKLENLEKEVYKHFSGQT